MWENGYVLGLCLSKLALGKSFRKQWGVNSRTFGHLSTGFVLWLSGGNSFPEAFVIAAHMRFVKDAGFF